MFNAIKTQTLVHLSVALIQTLGKRSVCDFSLEVGCQSGVPVALERCEDVTTAAVSGEQG